MLLFFGLSSYPGEIAYFNSPNRELSNGVRVMALYFSKIVDPCRKEHMLKDRPKEELRAR